jgi:transaldolase
MAISASRLRVNLFADGAEKAQMLEMYKNPLIKGFTTNPTLMRKAGITDYVAFAQDIVAAIPDRHISFEVFSDDLPGMERQARMIAKWGRNVYVKLPVTNTKREPVFDLINRLSKDGVRVNLTAVFTKDQVERAVAALGGHAPGCISVFAGRIADAGIDPVPVMHDYLKLIRQHSNLECIWASPRELLNVVQASDVGCHIITATPDILKKLSLLGKDLGEYSLETVKMFRDDAVAAGFTLPVDSAAVAELSA